MEKEKLLHQDERYLSPECVPLQFELAQNFLLITSTDPNSLDDMDGYNWY